jgi:hypothetical protein
MIPNMDSDTTGLSVIAYNKFSENSESIKLNYITLKCIPLNHHPRTPTHLKGKVTLLQARCGPEGG